MKVDKSKMLNAGKSTILGIQHMFAMMGATILVPMLCNLSVSVTLLCAGVGTIMFHFISKRKVPVFLGSSFAYVPVLIATIGKHVGTTEEFVYKIGSVAWQQQMGKVSVGIMMAGLVYLLVALLVKVIGVKKIKKLFPPIVVGPVIMVIGLNLAPVVLGGNIQGTYANNPELMGKTWLIVCLTVITIIAVALLTKGFFSSIPVLCGIIVGYITALACGMVSFSSVSNAPWIIFQNASTEFGFLKYLAWDTEVVLMFAPLALVTCMEHIGDISANSVVCGVDFMKDPGLHRTLTGDGIATFVAGLLGGPPNTTYGENTAVLAITKNYNPNNILLAGIFAVCLGVFSKFGGIIGTIPGAVVGGASLLLFGMITANGLKVLVEEKIDFAKPKNTFIVSIILVVGIGMSAAKMELKIGSVAISPLAIVTFLGIILNQLFVLAEKFVGTGKRDKDDEEKETFFEIVE
ncbi:MAG: uracil-xanthine permease family protein [Clostridia bacterium]